MPTLSSVASPLAEGNAHAAAVVPSVAPPTATLRAQAGPLPPVPFGFRAVTPTRVLDTRDGTGVTAPLPVRADSTIDLDLTDVLPSDATAVALNVTAVGATTPTFVTVWPTGQPRPLASNLNPSPGPAVPNMVVVALGTDQRVSLYNFAGSVHLVADVSGYYTSGFEARTPVRVLDTRDGTGQGTPGPVGAGEMIELSLAGIVPPTATSVVLNVTAVDATEPTFVTVWPTGRAQPLASNLNPAPGVTSPNLVVVGLGADQRISLYNALGSVHLVADLAGSHSDSFGAVSPVRVLDTRDGTGRPAPGPVAADETIRVSLAGFVPVDATAVVLNLTAVGATEPTFVTAWPAGRLRPLASNLNPVPGRTTPNLVVVGLGVNQSIELYNAAGSVHLVADVFGSPAPVDDVAPPPVSDLGATSTSPTSVTLTWTPPPDPDVAGVSVRRLAGSVPPTSRTDGAAVSDLAPGATTASDAGLAEGSTYSYAVITYDAAGNSSPPVTAVVTTLPDVTAPSPVTSVSATSTSSDSITLAWVNPPDADFTGVELRRAAGPTPPVGPADGTLVTILSGPTAQYVDRGLAAGTYSYALFARDEVPNRSARAAVTASTTPVPTPASVVARPFDAAVWLTWAGVPASNLASYRVYRSATPGGTRSVVSTVIVPSAVDQGRPNGVAVSYWVTAVDTAGNESAAAGPFTVTPTTASGVLATITTTWAAPGSVVLDDPRLGAPTTVEIVTPPTGATAGVSGRTVTVTPTTGRAATTQLTFRARSANGLSTTGVVAVTVTPVPQLRRCGDLGAAEEWAPDIASTYRMDCDARVPVSSTLTVRPGTSVVAAGTLTVQGSVSIGAAGGAGPAPLRATVAAPGPLGATDQAAWTVDLDGGSLSAENATLIGGWIGGFNPDGLRLVTSELVDTDVFMFDSTAPVVVDRIVRRSAGRCCLQFEVGTTTGQPVTVTDSDVSGGEGIRVFTGGAADVSRNTLLGFNEGQFSSTGIEVDQATAAPGTVVVTDNHVTVGVAPYVPELGVEVTTAVTDVTRSPIVTGNVIDGFQFVGSVTGSAVDPSRAHSNVAVGVRVPIVTFGGTLGADWNIGPSTTNVTAGIGRQGLRVPAARTMAMGAGARLTVRPQLFAPPLIVDGRFRATGTASSPAVITSAESTTWGALALTSSITNPVVLSDIVIERGGLNVRGTGPVTLTRVRAGGLGGGVFFDTSLDVRVDGDIRLTDVTAENAANTPSDDAIFVQQLGTGPTTILERVRVEGGSGATGLHVQAALANQTSPVLTDIMVDGFDGRAVVVDAWSLNPALLTNISATGGGANALFLAGRLTANLTLPRLGLPPVVAGAFPTQFSSAPRPLVVASPSVLRLEAGAVLKQVGSAGLVVEGSLITRGTSQNPAIVTVITDDTAGGDLNGDGAASEPDRGSDGIVARATATTEPTLDLEGLDVRWGGLYATDANVVRVVGSHFADGAGVTILRPRQVVVTGTSVRRSRTNAFVGSTIDIVSGIWVLDARTSVTVNDNFVDSTSGLFDPVTGIEISAATGVPIVMLRNSVKRTQLAYSVSGDVNPLNLGGNTATGVRGAALRLSGRLTGNLTLPFGTLPVVVGSSGLTVNAGVTMSVGPNQVVKSLGVITVNGTLTSAGIAGGPVTFTSFDDDTVGGDSNADGSTTGPAPGRWPGIVVAAGGQATLNAARIRYAATGVRNNSANVVTLRGELTGNTVGATSCGTGCPLDARLTWWGATSGPRPNGTGDQVQGNGVAYIPFLGQGLPTVGSYALDPYAGLVADVNPALGALVFAANDASIPVPGPALAVNRVYNSTDTRTTTMFGRGWSSSYEVSVTLPPDAAAVGAVITVNHPDGRTEAFTRPGAAWVGPAGSASTLAPAGTGWVYETRGGLTYSFDAGGRLTALADDLGRTLTMAYDGGGRLSTVTAGTGQQLAFGWTGAHVTAVSTPFVSAFGRALTWRYTYIGDELASACNPAGDDGAAACTTYERTGGRITKVILPSGRTQLAVTYSADGKVLTRTDGAGDTTTFTYTPPNVVAVTNARNATTTNVYDASLRLVRSTDPAGNATIYDYDSVTGLRSAVIDPLGNMTSWTYDADGNRLSQTDAEGYTEYYTYDANGDLVEYRGPRSDTASDNTYRWTYEYDASGNRISDRSPPLPGFPAGTVARRTFSVGTEPAIGGGSTPPGLILSETDARGAVTVSEYDQAGNLRRTTQPGGVVTEIDVDALGRPITKRLITTQHPAGILTTFAYDAAGRLRRVDHPATTDAVTGDSHQLRQEFTYDADGNLTRTDETDLGTGVTRTTLRQYDGAGRVITETDPELGIVRTTYDEAGNVAGVTDAEGRLTRFSYDSRNLLLTITAVQAVDDPSVPTAPRDIVVARHRYDAAGRRTGTWDGRNLLTEWALDGVGRVTAVYAGYPDPAPGEPFRIPAPIGFTDYDAAGNVVETREGMDVVGVTLRRTTMTYDAADRMISTQLDPGGLRRTTSYSLDAGGLPLTTTWTGPTARAESVTAAYDVAGRRTTESVATGNGGPTLTTSIGYTDDGQVASITDPRGVANGDVPGFTTDRAYDEAGRVIRVITPPVAVDGAGGPTSERATTTYGYDAFGDLVHERDPSGAIVTRHYDRMGRLTRTTWPSVTMSTSTIVTPTEQRAYDHVGNLVELVDRRGQTTRWVYNHFDEPVLRIDPAVGTSPSGTVRWEYDDAGNVIRTTDQRGAVVEHAYDHRNREIARTELVRQPLGVVARYVWSYEYDGLDNRIAVTDPTGQRSTWTYNAASEMLTGLDGDGVARTRTYDLRGRLVRSVDGAGRGRSVEFDLAGRMIAASDVTDTIERRTAYTLDAAGNVLEELTPAGRRTTFAYDARNLLTTATVYPTPTTPIVTSYGYDIRGLRTRVTDGRGNATTTRYNAWGLTAEVVEPATALHPQASDRTWRTDFDAAGNPVRELQPGGVAITRTFDALGRRVAEAGTGPGVVDASRAWSYDAAGRLSSFSTPAGSQTVSYDDRGLPLSSSGPLGSATLGYDAVGRLVTRQDASGVSHFSYTGFEGRLATASTTNGGSILQTFSYDASGAVTSVRSLHNGSESYEFRDVGERGQLDAVRYYDSGFSPIGSETRTYDADGLTISSTVDIPGMPAAGTSTYAYDGAARLVGWTRPDGSTEQYTWDAAGNRQVVGAPAQQYDERNRLVSAGAATYSYNARGDRIGEAGVTRTFDAFGQVLSERGVGYGYDALGRLAQRSGATFAYAALGTAVVSDGTATYASLPGGSPFAVNTAGGGRTLALNAHGDVTWAFDELGHLAGAKLHTPFGAPLAEVGEVPGNLGFDGGWTDPTTGTTKLGARWYDGAAGSFVSRDSFAGRASDPVTLNRYLYGNANPLDVSDPSGHFGLPSFVKKAVTTVTNVVKAVTKPVVTAAKTVATAVTSTVTKAVTAVVRPVANAVKQAASAVASVVRAAAPVVAAVVRVAVDVGRAVVQSSVQRVEQAAEKVVAVCSDAATLCGKLVSVSIETAKVTAANAVMPGAGAVVAAASSGLLTPDALDAAGKLHSAADWALQAVIASKTIWIDTYQRASGAVRGHVRSLPGRKALVDDLRTASLGWSALGAAIGWLDMGNQVRNATKPSSSIAEKAVAISAIAGTATTTVDLGLTAAVAAGAGSAGAGGVTVAGLAGASPYVAAGAAGLGTGMTIGYGLLTTDQGKQWSENAGQWACEVTSCSGLDYYYVGIQAYGYAGIAGGLKDIGSAYVGAAQGVWRWASDRVK